MHLIIIGIIILVVIGAVVGFIKDYLDIIIGLVVIIAGGFFVHWIYALAGFPVWPIALLILLLAIYNSICHIIYLLRKHNFRIFFEKAAVESEQINLMDNEIKKSVSKQISSAMTEMGMGTDKEIYDKLNFCDVKTLNSRKKDLKEKLAHRAKYHSGIQVIDQAIPLIDTKSIFNGELETLIYSGEIVIESNLNQESNMSWDKKLYRTTLECPNPSNMLPTVHLEID